MSLRQAYLLLFPKSNLIYQTKGKSLLQLNMAIKTKLTYNRNMIIKAKIVTRVERLKIDIKRVYVLSHQTVT